MFETSLLLFLKTLGVNILLPLIPGILFLRICFGKKFQGLFLYLLGWFVGVGVVAFSLFNLQFFHFGVGVGEYFFVLCLLVIIFLLQILLRKLSFRDYLLTLKAKNIFPTIITSFTRLPRIEKVFTIVFSVFGSLFFLLTSVYMSHFPSYALDNAINRNQPIINIYYDGGVKLIGENSEILGRARLGYPIYIAVYKATISHFTGGFNDIYINMWQWLVFLGLLLFIFTITFSSTKNIFYSLLPIGLIVSLPLIFFHASDGYMDLPCAVYSVLMIWSLWKFLEEKDYAYIPLALLLGSVLSHLKNDGLLGYFVGILIAFSFVLLISKRFISSISGFIRHKKSFFVSLFTLVFFLLPFLIIKFYYHLGFNQSAAIYSSVEKIFGFHPEIFSSFGEIFFSMDHYNLVLILLLLVGYFWYIYKRREQNTLFFLVAPFILFLIFVAIFLFTENYVYATTRLTISRLFTMVFLILFAFTGLIFYKPKDHLL